MTTRREFLSVTLAAYVRAQLIACALVGVWRGRQAPWWPFLLLPLVFGIAVIAPPLDKAGNSVKAQKAIADISNALGGNPLLGDVKGLTKLLRNGQNAMPSP